MSEQPLQQPLQKEEQHKLPDDKSRDNSDADAFAILSLLVIIGAALSLYLNS